MSFKTVKAVRGRNHVRRFGTSLYLSAGLMSEFPDATRVKMLFDAKNQRVALRPGGSDLTDSVALSRQKNGKSGFVSIGSLDAEMEQAGLKPIPVKDSLPATVEKLDGIGQVITFSVK